jgi:hypothetical protein
MTAGPALVETGPAIDVRPGKETIVREDRNSNGFIQDAPPASAQRADARLRAAVDEFEGALKIALDELFDAIDDITPRRFIELNDDDEEDPLGAEITVKGFVVDDAKARVSDAFAELGWPLERALRELRKALR